MASEEKDRPLDTSSHEEIRPTKDCTKVETASPGFSPARVVVFLSLAIGGCAADLWTKAWIFAKLGLPGRSHVWWIWDDVFGFQTNLNHGALFGLGQGKVDFFVVASIIAGIGVPLWFFLGRPRRDWTLTVSLGLILGGICGNLYDRLGLPGETGRAVRDWILVMLGDYHWPTFNIADSLLVCGAILMVFHATFLDRPTAKEAARKKKK